MKFGMVNWTIIIKEFNDDFTLWQKLQYILYDLHIAQGLEGPFKTSIECP